MVNNKLFELRPITQLTDIVKTSFRKFNAEGLIDDGEIVKQVLWCNDKLGLPIREIREAAIPVIDFKAKLPLDFEKVFFTCALRASNTLVTAGVNPFDNNFDRDVIYDAHLNREALGNVNNYQVVIKRDTQVTIHNFGTWVQLDIDNQSDKFCHMDCPNRRRKGRHTITIKDGEIHTPFRAGTIYLLYIGMMKDENGTITFPFHSMITPWYEWNIKYNIIVDAIFNSDIGREEAEYFRKLAEKEKSQAWADAYNFTFEKGFGEYVKSERRKELGWYNTWFKPFQNC